MAASGKLTNAGDYAQRLLENPYVQENISEALESLRAAYARASKRRVEPTTDEKVRAQLRQAALRLREAADALRTDRRRPKKRRGRRLMIVVVGAAGAAAAVASNEGLRRKLFGDPAQLVSASGPESPVAP